MSQAIINTMIILLPPPIMRIFFQPWNNKLNYFNWIYNTNKYTVLLNIKQP